MFLLRYLYILALVVWLGGLIVAGAIVAPSVFDVLQTSSAADGPVLAGAVFGAILRRLHLLAYAMGGVMLAVLTVQRVLGPRPINYGIRATVVGTMLAVTVISGSVISPRVETIVKSVDGPIASLPLGDARRAEFYRLHGWSNLLLAVTALGGLALLWWEARE
ncbi:MAG: DUF4149 domain-containing protein [Vicinamibacterales bacterium]